jgi:hypothetical protein
MRLIKLTDADGYTRRGDSGETLWLPCGTRPPRLDGAKLCAAGVYHAYSSPEQAAMMDCIHAELLSRGGRAWWAEGEVVKADGSKVGCHELVLVEPAELPVLTTAQRVRVAIYCAQELGSHGDAWDRWAERWLSGEDRSASSAKEAWAERAARADAADAAGAADAARSAAWAAWAAVAAEAAARTAAWAAEWAARAATRKIDISEIVRRAIREEVSK